MPNVMAALPNVVGALYSTRQSLADAHYYMACSNADEDTIAVEICRGAPKYRTDLSR